MPRYHPHLGILAVLSGVAMVPLALLARPAGSLVLGNLAIAAVIGVLCAAVGWLVARRQPRNPLGWLFLVIAVCPLWGRKHCQLLACGQRVDCAVVSRGG